MSSGVGCRHSLDLMLLWLWCRLAAVAAIQPLACGFSPPPKKKKKKAKSISQSYSLICAPLVLFLGLLMSKERQKATMGSSVFPFPSMLSFAA